MNRAVFADDILVPDLDLCFSIGRKRKILRRRADDCAVSDEIAGAYCDLCFNDGMRLNYGSLSDSYLRSNHRERTDLDIGADLRSWIDNGGRMNF